MTTGQSSVEAPAPVQQEACQFKYGRGRRKMKRACCCIVFLLLINAFLLMHTAHSVGAIMWFMINGSYTYNDTTYIFVPGGAKTLCNDLCVDMCIYRQVGCELNSCLNTCNEKLVEDGNEDDFQELPTHPVIEEMIIDFEPLPLDDGMTIDSEFYDELEQPVDFFATEEADDEVAMIPLVDTPQAPEYDDGITPDLYSYPPQYSSDLAQTKLDAMQKAIESAADGIRKLKAKYAEQCAADPEKFGCNLTRETIRKSIDSLKEQIEGYNSFAVEVNIDIQVQVWMVDVDQVTAEP